MWKKKLAIHQGFFLSFIKTFFLQQKAITWEIEFKEGLDLANKLWNTCLVKKLNANVVHFVLKRITEVY